MSRKMLRARWAIVGMLAVIACVGPRSIGAGMQDEVSGSGPAISARANRVLSEMGAYLASAGEFRFRADVAYDSVIATGQKIQYGGVANIAVRRPDRLRAEFRGDERKSTALFDGSRVTILDRERNLYAHADVPGDIDGAVDHIFDIYGFSIPIADFVYANPHEVLTEYVEKGVWMGRHLVDGTPCHHLAFTQESIDWQIWIEDGPRPVPRKLVITYKDQEQAPQYTVRLSKWDFQPRLSDGWFMFVPPIGASEIEFMPVWDDSDVELEDEE